MLLGEGDILTACSPFRWQLWHITKVKAAFVALLTWLCVGVQTAPEP